MDPATRTEIRYIRPKLSPALDALDRLLRFGRLRFDGEVRALDGIAPPEASRGEIEKTVEPDWLHSALYGSSCRLIPSFEGEMTLSAPRALALVGREAILAIRDAKPLRILCTKFYADFRRPDARLDFRVLGDHIEVSS